MKSEVESVGSGVREKLIGAVAGAETALLATKHDKLKLCIDALDAILATPTPSTAMADATSWDGYVAAAQGTIFKLEPKELDASRSALEKASSYAIAALGLMLAQSTCVYTCFFQSAGVSLRWSLLWL